MGRPAKRAVTAQTAGMASKEDARYQDNRSAAEVVPVMAEMGGTAETRVAAVTRAMGAMAVQ
jgi:hypothetical protein